MLNLKSIELTRKKMQEANIDALLITNMPDIKYYSGINFHPGERFVAFLVTRDDLCLIVNKLFPQEEIENLKIFYYTDTKSPLEYVSPFIKPSGVLGVDKFMFSHFLIKWMRLRQDVSIEIGSEIVDKIKMIKDQYEIEKMINASKINDTVMKDLVKFLEKNPNVTELEVADTIKAINLKYGIEKLSFTPIVCFGKNAAEPHHENDETMLQNDNAIIIDMGGVFEGYCSDMTRTFYKGKPSERFSEVYTIVKEANENAIRMVKPGIKLSEIDRAARDYIESKGYGDYFTHRTGHGIGGEVHEYPDVSSISDVVCEPGMFFSIEPGIYLPGEFGIRIEDLICVTHEGCKVLNEFSKNLINFM